jgi:hypothetical protein
MDVLYMCSKKALEYVKIVLFLKLSLFDPPGCNPVSGAVQ